jgi:redox-sensitive bicupin YhaK (pirin superfamily)
MKPASYRDIQPDQIPALNLPDGGLIKIIAGFATINGKIIPGPIQGISTEPLFLDVQLPPGGHFTHPVVSTHNAFLYPYEGRLTTGPLAEQLTLEPHAVGVLSEGDHIEVTAGDEGAAFLVLAARPLREPIVQHGPFVMNTLEEIEQAITDYRNDQLV